MKGVALESANRDIRVNCINPEMVETDLFKGSNIGAEDLENDRLKCPLKRFKLLMQLYFCFLTQHNG